MVALFLADFSSLMNFMSTIFQVLGKEGFGSLRPQPLLRQSIAIPYQTKRAVLKKSFSETMISDLNLYWK
jgi:hypothetical protein